MQLRTKFILQIFLLVVVLDTFTKMLAVVSLSSDGTPREIIPHVIVAALSFNPGLGSRSTLSSEGFETDNVIVAQAVSSFAWLCVVLRYSNRNITLLRRALWVSPWVLIVLRWGAFIPDFFLQWNVHILLQRLPAICFWTVLLHLTRTRALILCQAAILGGASSNFINQAIHPTGIVDFIRFPWLSQSFIGDCNLADLVAYAGTFAIPFVLLGILSAKLSRGRFGSPWLESIDRGKDA